MLTEAKEKLEETREKWTEQLKKVILASIGGAVLVQEEIEDFINKCVEKGQLAEKDGKSLLKDLLKKRKKETKEKVASLESTIDGRIESILAKMHIPSKEDVQKMNEKLEQVLGKLDQLENKKASSPVK
jgi:poly(hydroxyalkanoate) granule-associated protein